MRRQQLCDYLICRGNNLLLDRIWLQHFKPRFIARKSDGAKLTYYKDWLAAADSLPGLLNSTDGQCGAFSELLLTALGDQGLIGTRDRPGKLGAVKAVRIVPRNPPLINATDMEKANLRAGFLVNTWAIPGKGGSNPDAITQMQYPAISYLVDGFTTVLGIDYPQFDKVGNNPRKWQYRFTNQPVPAEVTYGGSQAQNNGNPLASFTNHIVVEIGGKFYDPSTKRDSGRFC
jgi:hypothetical protein